MLAKKKPTHPILHIAIDVQSRYVRKLGRKRQAEFPQAVRNFADILREHYIPTVWVALLDRFRFHPRRAEWSSEGTEKRRDKQLEKFDLAGIAARRDEDVFIKKANNAFEQLLTERLKEYGTTTLIITGMNTQYCVAATVFGAAQQQLRCLVVTDLLADMRAHDLLDSDTAWHRRTVEKSFLKLVERKISTSRERKLMLARVEYCTLHDILAAHRKSPELVKKLAKALCGRRKLPQ